MECSACSEVIPESSDHLVCASCKQILHYTCAGYDDKSYKKLSVAQKKRFNCSACGYSCTKSNPGTSVISSDQLKEVETMFVSNMNELKEFVSSKLDDFKTSLEFNSSVIEDLKTTIAELKTTTTNLKQENEKLKTENLSFKKELKYIKQEVTELQQYSRRCNIEINNVPEVENENLSEVLSKIGALSNCQLKDNIIVAHRIPSFNKDKPKPIIVQLSTKPVRDSLLKLLKDRKLKTTDINQRLVEMPIYFNEHLAPELKKLFYLARKYKTENNFQYCWVKDGKILIRKSESSRIHRIKNEDDLNVQYNN